MVWARILSIILQDMFLTCESRGRLEAAGPANGGLDGLMKVAVLLSRFISESIL